MIRIERIDRSHPLYEQEVELRERVLLTPIGIGMETLESLFPGFEDRFEHFVAVVDHPKGERVVGCVCLLAEKDAGRGKLMQMAVDPQRQREGIGRKLVVALERRAFGELGLTELYCHARFDAVAFYEGLGWEVVGDPFQEAGIEHRVMTFRADSSAPGDASSESINADSIGETGV